MKDFKTAKGTVLPILNLRGKDYLEVKYRLVWFREEHPDWSIETEIKRNDNETVSKATIRDTSGRIMAQAHKVEDKQGFNDHTEKSETGAIGRALALCGYGTQFCADELDEGDRIVDAPIDPKKPNSPPNDIDPGEYRVKIGKKYNGRLLKDILPDEIQSHYLYLESEAERTKIPLRGDVLEFTQMARKYLVNKIVK
jgi:hypothetical protein